jgi:hypothetical protein
MSGGPVIDVPRFFRDITGVTQAESDLKKARKRAQRGLTAGATAETQVSDEDMLRIRMQRGKRARAAGRAGTVLTQMNTVLGTTDPQAPTLLGL